MLSTGGTSNRRPAADEIDQALEGRCGQIVGSLVGLGGDHRQADHDMRLVEIFGRLEEVAMHLDRPP